MRVFLTYTLFLFVLLFFNGIKNIEAASTTETKNEVAHVYLSEGCPDHFETYGKKTINLDNENSLDDKSASIKQGIIEMNKKNKSFVLITKNNQVNFDFSIKNRTQLFSFFLQEYFLLKQHINKSIDRRAFLYNIVCENIHINKVVEYYIFSLRKILI